MLLALVISVVAVASGLGLGLAPAVTRRAIGPLRTLSLTAVLAVVFLHLMPEALRDLGPVGLVVFGLGLALPRWSAQLRGGTHSHAAHADSEQCDRASDARQISSSAVSAPGAAASGRRRDSLASRGLSVWPRLGLELGFWGLLIHHVGDGLALGAYSRVAAPDEHVHSDVLLALVLHTVPLVAVVTSSYVRAFGTRSALSRGAGLALASVLGVVFAGSVPSVWVDAVRPWIAAGVSGLLLHSLSHDLGSDLPSSGLGRAVDLGMALLGGALGYVGEHLSTQVESGAHGPVEFALRVNLERAAPPLLVGVLFGAWLPARLPSLLRSTTSEEVQRRGGAWSPEAFLSNLAHFGFVFAAVRDVASLVGLGLARAPEQRTAESTGAPIVEPEPSPPGFLGRLTSRLDAQLAWALLGVMVASVVNVALPDKSLLPHVWLGIIGAALFAVSVPLHAAAAPPLALALLDKGLTWPAAFLLVWLPPLAAELSFGRRVVLAVIGAAALVFAARIWELPSRVMPTGVGLFAAVLLLTLLLARAYRVGLRGLLAAISA